MTTVFQFFDTGIRTDEYDSNISVGLDFSHLSLKGHLCKVHHIAVVSFYAVDMLNSSQPLFSMSLIA
ncbi:hypothetical protein [Psychrobium sp. 1_MG-2023]|uniref:hypothetical protein n=1 Tax=Psychrobium sp. 1_MG-2023 TaxID=3062624 RepID=UPI0012921C88|nr:hypothetical protein [Psychrobium sp. 1_MG-2023]MDP2562657.1 hypothetical protein [Psychrobium sp. 1_MG-2023]